MSNSMPSKCVHVCMQAGRQAGRHERAQQKQSTTITPQYSMISPTFALRATRFRPTLRRQRIGKAKGKQETITTTMVQGMRQRAFKTRARLVQKTKTTIEFFSTQSNKQKIKTKTRTKKKRTKNAFALTSLTWKRTSSSSSAP